MNEIRAKEYIEYDYLKTNYSDNIEIIDKIKDIVFEILCCEDKTIMFGNTEYDTDEFKKRVKKLDEDLIIDIIEKIKSSKVRITNPESYLTKIHLKMPIYLGCSDYNMSIGAAQLGQTSIPFGGKNTNAVIAGHCGYGYRDYFRHIEKLRPGDVVRITTPFNKLKYIVKKRKIVKPKNRDEIRIQDDKDMVTLFTCYPYPTNKYRCCIICERESD